MAAFTWSASHPLGVWWWWHNKDGRWAVDKNKAWANADKRWEQRPATAARPQHIERRANVAPAFPKPKMRALKLALDIACWSFTAGASWQQCQKG